MKDVTDLMDRFTTGNVMSSEEIQIIMYSLDLTAGGGGLDDDGSAEGETGEFTEHTHPLVSKLVILQYLPSFLVSYYLSTPVQNMQHSLHPIISVL